MNAKITSLFAGIALLAGVGVANAEERLTAASMDEVTAAGGYRGHYYHPHGTQAQAKTFAACTGSGSCSTEVKAEAVVGDNYSISQASAIASSH
jgi:hypothetical protein